jgi:ketosteroid isomerase-like protein
MKADQRTENEVPEVLTRVSQAYARRDMDSLLSCFVPDADLIMYGTGADEKRIGPGGVEEQARRDWSQSDAMALELGWHSVSAAGPVAWVAADAAFKGRTGGQEFVLPARLTAVLEKRDTRWLVAQMHFSMPLSAQGEGESFPS